MHSQGVYQPPSRWCWVKDGEVVLVVFGLADVASTVGARLPMARLISRGETATNSTNHVHPVPRWNIVPENGRLAGNIPLQAGGFQAPTPPTIYIKNLIPWMPQTLAGWGWNRAWIMLWRPLRMLVVVWKDRRSGSSTEHELQQEIWAMGIPWLHLRLKRAWDHLAFPWNKKL